MWRKGNLNHSALFVEMQLGTTTMENSVWRSLKKLKMELSYGPAISFLGIYLKKPETKVEEYIHPYGHCVIIYNSQDAEAIQVHARQ